MSPAVLLPFPALRPVVHEGVPWSVFVAARPGLAEEVLRSLAAHPRHVLATVAADGSARVSGTALAVSAGELWFACPPSAARSIDLRRDPRVALHTNPGDGTLSSGEAKLTGTAQAVSDAGARERLLGPGPGHDAAVVDGVAQTLSVFVLRLRALTYLAGSDAPVVTWRAG